MNVIVKECKKSGGVESIEAGKLMIGLNQRWTIAPGRCRLVVRTPDCGSGNRGSNPRTVTLFLLQLLTYFCNFCHSA